MAKQAVTVELFYNEVWNDHTSSALVRDEISITRGRANESSQPAPTTCTLTFSGWRFNPANPSSDLFGLIGRNTPLRVTVGTSVRFAGQVSSWTPRQSLGGPVNTPDRWVEVEAAGITRRLGQGQDPLQSVVFRETMAAGNAAFLVAYWPCEDESRASQLYSPMPGVAPMTFTPGAVQPGSYSGFTGSRPIATITEGGQEGSETARGTIPAYSGDFFFRALVAISTDGLPDLGQVFAWLFTGGDIAQVELEYTFPGTGALRLRVFDVDGVEVATTASTDFALNDTQALISVELVQNGADIDWLIFVRQVGLDGSVETGTIPTGTFTGLDLGRARTVVVGGENPGTMSFGHVMVGNSQSLVFNIGPALTGWVGEHTGDRFIRLTSEENITSTIAAGTQADTVPCGPQHPDGLLAILREAAAVDDGLLIDQRGGFGALDYRTGRNRYNQAATLALDYDAGEVAPPLEPTLDDQQTRNDVTAKRRDGGEARAVDAASVDAIGRYDAQVTVNPMGDGPGLAAQAGWRLHLGTTTGTRFPKVTVDLDASPGLVASVDATDAGDRITIANLPAELTPDLANLLALGYTETIGSHRRKITFNCAPESPYHILEVEHATLATLGSTATVLLLAMTTVSTSVDLDLGAGPDWVHEGTDYDLLIGGERMTVTGSFAASGTFPNRTQTLLVTRAVNGILKAHPIGTPVRLFHPAYIGL